MKKRLMVIITAAMLICSLNAYAEMVYLKDGQVISGKIISEDRVWITVKSKYQTVRFKRSEIKRIMYGDRKMEEIYIDSNKFVLPWAFFPIKILIFLLNLSSSFS